MRHHARPVRLGVLLAVGLASACAVEDASDLPGYEDIDEPAVDRAGDPIAAQVCTADHYVVRTFEVGCPNVGGWQKSALFPQSMFHATGGQPQVPAELARYCRYDWPSGMPPAGQVALLANHSAFAEVGRDCRAVTPETDAITAAVGDDLLAAFRHQVGRQSAAQLGGAAAEADRTPVTVAVVDTLPPMLPTDPTSDHGPIVRDVVLDVACPGNGCAVDVPAHLGLPRTATGYDANHGGVIGLQGDVARGIFDAVERFRDAQAAGDSQRLVINMSFGWEATLFGGDMASAPPAVDAVRVAIEYARCRGAIPIAAAGNHTGLTCTEQALAPALWERDPRPNAQRCAQLGVTNPAPDGGTAYAPLLWAVGGLEVATETMPGTRDTGKPRLFAPGTFVVAEDEASSAATPPRTGTSMAAAATSGAAGLVWSFNPTLRPSQLMDLLYLQGAAVGASSDYGLGGAGQAIRRVDACEALDAACGLPGAACNDVPQLTCGGPPPVALTDVAAQVQALPATTVAPALAPGFDDCVDACGQPRRARALAGQVPVCQSVDPEPLLRLTQPQPNKPGCTTCTLTSQGAAHLSLSDDYADAEVTAVTIHVVDATTGRTHSYALGDQPLGNATVTEIAVPLSNDGVVPRSATITISYTGLRDTVDPLPVL